MGVHMRPAPRLMWVCGFVLFCALLLHTSTPVSADLKEDSDLVFDALESTNLRNHRIARDSSSYSQSESSQPTEDDHWLFGTVNRIKRSIGSIFSKNEDRQNPKHPDKLDLENKHAYHPKGKAHDTHDSKHPNLLRNHRQIEYDEVGQEEDDYKFNGQYEDLEDENENNGQYEDLHEGDEIYDNNEYHNGFSDLEIGGSGNYGIDDKDYEDEDDAEIIPGVDDEDQQGFGSGKGGSGEVEPIDVTPKPTTAKPHIPLNPRYYRFILTIQEPYLNEFKDFDSSEFQSLAQRVARSIDKLFESVPGRHVSTVISIDESKDDSFKVRATVDLQSISNLTNVQIENHILSKIIEEHRLDQVIAVPDNFKFIPFEENRPFCSEQEITCRRSRQCVNLSARCNYIFECNDKSDEDGCPTTTTTFVQTTTSTTTTTTTAAPTTTTTATTTTTTTTEPSIEGSAEEPIEEPERADDIVRCDDGYGTYLGDQRCDGNKDCADGSDEKNCPKQCAQGEFSCDINRCIPVSDRCNGVRHCSDGTDEQECESCSEGAFHCDGNKCISADKKCDRVSDCRDGSDEHNCEGACSFNEFDCKNGQCIPNIYRCSGTTECSNGEDEINCPRQGRCSDNEFECSSGECIPRSKYCDREYDCNDQSDERSCPCKEGDFHCDNGFCIPHNQRCDGIRQCQDQSDEYGCETNERPCESYQWRCKNGQCIDQINRCNFKNDCADGSDEQLCNVCGSDTFRCNNGTCISLDKRCNGESDCANQEDEEHCDTTRPNECPPEKILCNDGSCVPGTKCDQIYDCIDGTDEDNCIYCNQDQFPCISGGCIDLRLRCDGLSDCKDHSDEKGCGNECEVNEFDCGDGTCVSINTRCDGYEHCLTGRDEDRCPSKPVCRGDELECGDGSCFNIQRRCDGYMDCLNGRDEESCPPQQCNSDQFDCGEGVCIDINMKCDGYSDCLSNIDEQGCPGVSTTSCPADKINCGDGSCIDVHFKCDGVADCSNGADELNCACNSDEFQCEDSTCIPLSGKCDGYNDCPDGSDESTCLDRVCRSDEFRCNNGKCIPAYQKCDTVPNCDDRSDERDCPSLACLPNEFRCSDGQCIDKRLQCDGRPDCRDRSDEDRCLRPTTKPEILPTVPTVSCPSFYVPCLSGDKCIQANQLCDGHADCRDLSDESNCDASAQGLQLKTYPTQQQIRENKFKLDREVVFQCRDEGPIRARVQWKRANGLPLPPGSRDVNGRLEIPNIKVEHAGTYICAARDFPLGTPGAEIAVQLYVDKAPPPFAPSPVKCHLNESTCGNGECIPRNKVCDGQYDCTDGSDEIRCSLECEPSEFKCNNKKCVHKSWVCDSEDDCGDGSDESVCAPYVPGQACGPHQFACRNGQCIPRSYHCDGSSSDCTDKSDEIGCIRPVISENPVHMLRLAAGSVFQITCRAVGVPTPQIIWRLNWRHVPLKCKMTSVEGLGTLTCEDIQIEDQGAYTCEAISTLGTVMSSDTILEVYETGVCRPGYFNSEARAESECIKCFCFGHTSTCRSADLFIFEFQPPFDSLKMLGVRIDPYTGIVDIRDEPIYKGVEPYLQHIGSNGVKTFLANDAELNQPNVVPYFSLPENYHRNQLKSYGGYLKYNVHHSNDGRPITGPDVVLTGNRYILLHESNSPPKSHRTTQMRVRFFEGDWTIKSVREPSRPATREEIMMALEDVTNILIKLEYSEGVLNTTLSNIVMDSAGSPATALGAANYVEECSCPVGYLGTSCEYCAEGYSRHESGPWLGQCYKEPKTCPPGSYSDGTECQICPCPFTSPSNQFARTCHRESDGSVTCDCQAGYVGKRCEACAPGYVGNPLTVGDFCRPDENPCDPLGTLGRDAEGRCLCKEFTTGPFCNQCKDKSFYLSAQNQFGCISCFCMGVTQQCSSSNWYRDIIQTVFTNSNNDFKLTDINREEDITQGIYLNQNSREIYYSSFSQPEVYYWSLPIKYLGDKVTSYGGYLRYTIRNTPVPGGASSRNNAPDVELVSENQINLLHFSSNKSQSTNAPQTFVVPLLEQYWQRNDGLKTDREHLLMALADVKAIYIKATYFTNTQEAALISVSLDTASEHNTGLSRAWEVEQCQCPVGYTGLSCEDCAFGYTRSDDGIYLELCIPCECNGFSNECHPETGECQNCRDNTAGDFCDQCLPGYTGDPTRSEPCRYSGVVQPCNCNPKGSTYNGCINGVCECKSNVEGSSCDRCRNGTFGLSEDNIDGCEFCFCSGVSTECSESRYNIEQIPVQIIEDHGFILTDQYYRTRIDNDFITNLALNEIGFNFPPSQRERLYWSLPSTFTGNQIKSYGGKLEYMQKYIDLPDAKYSTDKDVIIKGNNIIIYWTNPNELKPEILNSVSVRLHPSAIWYRLDQNRAPRPASREDILTVLANIESILIRATLSTDTSSTFLSDITLDTAVDVYNGKSRATNVELCRCPQGYRGTSCEACASGYYKDLSFSDTNPLGTCRRCPCSNREESCQYGGSQGVICNCLPGYYGRSCESTEFIPIPSNNGSVKPPEPPTIDVIISGHQLQIYEIGSSVRFNCSAVSRVAPRTVRVRWTKDSGDLPYHAIDDGRGILYIRNLAVSDSGRYTCEAEDGYSVVTESINVIVGESRDMAPTIALSAPYVQVSEGQLIEVRCAASGSPLPEYVLTRIDRQPLNPQHYFEQGVFRILQARTEDAGQYQCTAVNRAGQDSSSFEVQVVAGSVLRVEITPNSFQGQSGDNVVLRCIADRARSISWSKEGGSLPYTSRDENGLLMISAAQPEDSGIYICTATSFDGTRGTQTATVTISRGISSYPSARVSEERLTLRQGESKDIICEVSGSPTPTVKWTRAHGVMSSNFEQIGNTLHIRNAHIEDRGLYLCVASNDLGMEQAVATVEVTRFEAPLLSIYPEGSITVTAGNNAQLQCRAVQGYPSPIITWSRANDLPFSPNVEVMSGGNLKILTISRAEAGEYLCIATNDAGRAKATAVINVISVPELYIVPSDEVITKAANEYLRLECRGIGEPEPAVYWSRTDSISGSRLGAGNVAIREFTRLRPEDGGLYSCYGENNAGTSEKRVLVNVLPERGDNPGGFYPGGDAPSQVEEFTAIAGARAELRCKISSPENILHHIDWIRPNNASLPTDSYVRDGTLYIDNVQPSAAGNYECVSYELPSRAVLFRIMSRLRVVSPPRISLNPARQTVEPGDNAYIQCSATGDQPIDIQWHPVDRIMPASVYTHDGYIRFSNIHQSDAGRYRCTARNSAGEADSVAEVAVEFHDPDVRQPVINANNHQISSAPGNLITLVCTVGANSEQATIEWRKEGEALPDNADIIGTNLIITDLRKDNEGRYYCEVYNPNGVSSDYVDLQVVGPYVKSLPSPTPVLHISPQQSEYEAGETVDLNCQSNEPGVIPTWSKLNGGLSDNVQNRAGRLRIHSVRSDNEGVYRCEATGRRGNYYRDFNLYVRDNEARDEIPIQVQRAKRSATVTLECNTDLEQPVSYYWSKQGGSLPYYVDEYSKKIQINSVGAFDAGTYICTATNQQKSLDIPIILIVTGIIPYFTQAPNSYITLPTLPDAYLQFSFAITFKPENEHGLILYNGNRERDRDGDFISLALDNSIPEFKYNLGSGTTTTTVRAGEPITRGEWHTIKVVRNKKRVILFVDGKGPYIGENDGKYFGLDLSDSLFLGGVPDYRAISPDVGMDSGFVGCISKFKIGYTHQDILQESLNSTGLTNCETCTENKCQNQGACQESLTTEGYTCICPLGFSGPTCNKRKGEACSPYSCGVGRCIDTDNGYQCQCPLGRGGKHCEKTIQVIEPAFSNNAYIAYPPLKPLRRTKIEMKIKPRDITDGVLLYAAETNEGHGDFISLAIKDRHLEFRFDNGQGPYIIKSDQEIVPNQWSTVLAIRSLLDGKVIIDGRPSSPTKVTGNYKALTLLTPVYVGGYDKYNVKLNKGVKVENGFNGCISDINISGLDDAMLKNITDSSNVEDCAADEGDIDNNIYSPNENQYKPMPYDNKKTGCSDNPCKNNAPCIPLSPIDYRCACSAGFTGKTCETTVDLCKNRPCQHGGFCKSNSTGFTCDCSLGFAGNTCEQRIELRNDASFNGNGWLEFSRSLLSHKNDNEPEIIAVEFSTNKSDGLIFWHGQNPKVDGRGQDFISLALVNGYLEFSYDLGDGPVTIRNTQIRVYDGERHSVILKRQGRIGSIDIDNMYTEDGEADGFANTMNCEGNIYLGGAPNINTITGGKFTAGFNGCIHGFEIQQSKTLDLGMKAIYGLNVKPCSSFHDIDNIIWDDS